MYSSYSPLLLPLNGTDSTEQIIAPYWADVDTSGTGQIFYCQSTDPSLLARATSEIQAAFPASENVTIQSLVIVTWHKVGYYNSNTDKVGM